MCRASPPAARRPAGPGRPPAPGRGARRSGLTLLEVLGAVALLGILYTVLVTQNIQGVRAEGQSRRRLEASLLADQSLAELEMQIAAGSAPPVGRTEQESGDYLVLVDVTPFEPPDGLLDGPEGEASRAPRGGSPPSLFSVPRGGTPALRTVQLSVMWIDDYREEGDQAPRYASRTTYALDMATASALLGDLAQAGGGEP